MKIVKDFDKYKQESINQRTLFNRRISKEDTLEDTPEKLKIETTKTDEDQEISKEENKHESK